MLNLFNAISNLFMKPLLRSPLHFIASNSLMLLSFSGGDSGKIFTTPVGYKRDQNSITVLARKERGWWRNLRGGAPITMRLCGQTLSGVAEVPKMDKGSLFETVKWMHPTMPVEQVADMLPELIVVQIHLPVTAAVAA